MQDIFSLADHTHSFSRTLTHGKTNINKYNTVIKYFDFLQAKSLSETVDRMTLTGLDILDAKTTPERIEFENLTAASSDIEEAPSEMDEDEWTDRNFGASTVEGSSDSLSDLRYILCILLLDQPFSCIEHLNITHS